MICTRFTSAALYSDIEKEFNETNFLRSNECIIYVPLLAVNFISDSKFIIFSNIHFCVTILFRNAKLKQCITHYRYIYMYVSLHQWIQSIWIYESCARIWRNDKCIAIKAEFVKLYTFFIFFHPRSRWIFISRKFSVPVR